MIIHIMYIYFYHYFDFDYFDTAMSHFHGPWLRVSSHQFLSGQLFAWRSTHVARFQVHLFTNYLLS